MSTNVLTPEQTGETRAPWPADTCEWVVPRDVDVSGADPSDWDLRDPGGTVDVRALRDPGAAHSFQPAPPRVITVVQPRAEVERAYAFSSLAFCTATILLLMGRLLG